MSDPFISYMEWRDAVLNGDGDEYEYESLADMLRHEDELDEARDVLKQLEKSND